MTLQGIASAAFLPLVMGLGGLAAGAGGSMLLRTSCPSRTCSVKTRVSLLFAYDPLLGWGTMLQHSH